ncbi:formylglycine-generating enzyme family protein [Bradyrhizobium sp.]|uniref:formylglycine-generating enzyme family protein n=1 Tax=Bradyrhizobium sp. TaxID=376 RepID=UPI003C795B61
MRSLARVPGTRVLGKWAAGLTFRAALAAGFAATPSTPSESIPPPFGGMAVEVQLHCGHLADRKVVQLQELSERTMASPRTFRDCSDCPEMVEVPAGRFIMGSADGDPDERPAHEVLIRKPFAVGKFEVTFAEWEVCATDGGCLKNKSPGDEGWGKARRPVINVSWNDANEYLAWLSRRTGKPYRLLTEAEWEYAARADTSTKYAFGDSINKQQAQFSNGKPGAGQTVEVGSFAANAWDLYDMHGNVWEWVEDCYAPSYVEAPADGSARAVPGCPSRVLRGGSWDYGPRELRSAVRYRLPVIYRVDEIGFRVARDF